MHQQTSTAQISAFLDFKFKLIVVWIVHKNISQSVAKNILQSWVESGDRWLGSRNLFRPIPAPGHFIVYQFKVARLGRGEEEGIKDWACLPSRIGPPGETVSGQWEVFADSKLMNQEPVATADNFILHLLFFWSLTQHWSNRSDFKSHPSKLA